MDKIADIVGVRGRFGLIYGRSGDGKTSCLRKLNQEEGKIITLEPNGLVALQRFGIEEVNAVVPDTTAEYIAEILEVMDNGTIKWLCLDTVTMYYELVWQNYLDVHKKEPHETDFTAYRYCLHWFNRMLVKCNDVVRAGVHVILLSHLDQKEERDVSSSVTWTMPDLPGKLPDIVGRKLDFILRANKIQVKGERRYVLSNPTGRSLGKDLHGIVDQPIENDVSLLLVDVIPPAPAKPLPKKRRRLKVTKMLEEAPESTTENEPPADGNLVVEQHGEEIARTDSMEEATELAEKTVAETQESVRVRPVEKPPDDDRPITTAQKRFLFAEARRAEKDAAYVLAWVKQNCGVTSVKQLRNSQMPMVVSHLGDLQDKLEDDNKAPWDEEDTQDEAGHESA